MGSHSVTCYPTEVILTPLPPAYCRYSFIDSEKMKGWVDLDGWLYQDGLLKDSHPSGINRARRRVTTLIETNALPPSQCQASGRRLKKKQSKMLFRHTHACITSILWTYWLHVIYSRVYPILITCLPLTSINSTDARRCHGRPSLPSSNCDSLA